MRCDKWICKSFIVQMFLKWWLWGLWFCVECCCLIFFVILLLARGENKSRVKIERVVRWLGDYVKIKPFVLLSIGGFCFRVIRSGNVLAFLQKINDWRNCLLQLLINVIFGRYKDDWGLFFERFHMKPGRGFGVNFLDFCTQIISIY